MKGVIRVDPTHHTAEQVGDEPLLLARIAPCYVGKNRRISAEMAIAEGADMLLMDDGLQNPQLAKTLSVLVIDGGYGFGNGRVFPAGPLREPLQAVFAKVQLCVLIGKDTAGVIGQLPRTLPLIRAQMVLDIPDGLYPPTQVVAFCGIARPSKFYESVIHAGLDIAATHDFPDHHLFTEEELQHIEDNAAQHQARLVTTQKDWVRLSPAWQEKVTALPARLIVNDTLLMQVLNIVL
jgi:tetraacyldisaccharide 4'-kinase